MTLKRVILPVNWTRIILFYSPLPNLARKGETRIKMTRMRARIAERLKESQNTCASLTTLNEIDMRFDIIVRLISGRAHVHCGRSKIVDIRKRYKELFREQHGINLGFMSAFLAASVAALKEQPVVNAGALLL
jgi:2-oxoglutarate dehydrogenase E2 component (dihydrolipoamide succinyltransferase)